MSPEPEFKLPVTEDEYNAASSKFVSLPGGSTDYKKNVGLAFGYNVEVTEVDWDTPGSSMKIVVVVTEEGANKGKSEKISFGVKADGIWKGKELHYAITGKEMAIVDNAPVIRPLELVGKPAVGIWQVMQGTKGGVPGAEPVCYPKLENLLPAGSKPPF